MDLFENRNFFAINDINSKNFAILEKFELASVETKYFTAWTLAYQNPNNNMFDTRFGMSPTTKSSCPAQSF